MTSKINTTLRNLMAETVGSSFSGSNTLTIYEGTQPATANDAATGSTALLVYDNIYFVGTASGGAVALDIGGGVPQTLALADGTAQWGRLASSGGYVIDGNVATSAAQFVISGTSLLEDDLVTLNSCNIVMPAA